MLARDKVVETLRTVLDPEIGLDIWFLGLIYNIDIKDAALDIEMTFTTAACPYGPILVDEVKQKLSKLEGAGKVEVKVVFEPPWEPSDDVKALLGIL